MGLIVSCDDLGWGAVSKSFVEPSGVPPVNPVHRRELDFCYPCPGLGVDQLGFVEPVGCLGEGVVVGIANCSGRGGDAMVGKQTSISDRDVLRAMIGMVNQGGKVSLGLANRLIKGPPVAGLQSSVLSGSTSPQSSGRTRR